MNYDNVKFHDVLEALGIKGWKILTAPETEEYFLANFERRTGMGTNDTGEPMAVFSSDVNDFGVTWSQITAKHAELVTEYNNKEYARNRAAEYPSMADQLDDIYHNGIDAWKATIKTTKDKYPKP
jgi:hypothetical protein